MSPHGFLDALMALAAAFEYRVTSYYRDPTSNKQLGGAEHSAHLFFLAADVVLLEAHDRPLFIADAIRLGLRPIVEKDHIHLQPLDWKRS